MAEEAKILNDETKYKQQEPKFVNRFLLSLPEPFKVPQWACKQCDRPIFLGHGNWDDMVFVFNDVIGLNSTTTGFITGIREMQKLDSQEITLTLQMLGPVGDIVEEWKITGEIKLIDFGKLDYESTNPVEITMVFEPHTVILNF